MADYNGPFGRYIQLILEKLVTIDNYLRLDNEVFSELLSITKYLVDCPSICVPL